MARGPGQRWRVAAEGFSFLEGPRWRDGKLYVSDFYLKTVFAIGPLGEREVVTTVPKLPSGLGFTPSGDLLAVSMLDRRLLRIRNDGSHEVMADLADFSTSPCNDLYVDAVGRAYVGNFGWDTRKTDRISATRLLMVAPDGGVTIAAEKLIFPNGMARSAADNSLLVAETFGARICAFDVAADGSLHNRRLWADFTGSGRTFATISEAQRSGFVLPDGIASDAEGHLWVADSGGTAAVLVGPGGEILDTVDVGPLTPFAVALGGDDGRTLYVCAAPPLGGDEAGRIHRLEAKLLACDVAVGAPHLQARAQA